MIHVGPRNLNKMKFGAGVHPRQLARAPPRYPRLRRTCAGPLPPALTVEPNHLFFAPVDVHHGCAGFRRVPVRIQGLEKEDLIT